MMTDLTFLDVVKDSF